MKVNYLSGRDRVDAFDRDYPFRFVRVDPKLKLNKETFERYNEKFKLQTFLDEFKRQNPTVDVGSVILTNFTFVLVSDDKFNENQIRECIEQMKETIVHFNATLGNKYKINSIGIDQKLLGFTNDEFAHFIEILNDVLKDVECDFTILLEDEIED